MKRAWIVLLGFLAMGAGAPFPEAWRHWRYARPVELPAADSPRLARVEVPPAMYGRARHGLPDLRVIDDRGVETPFLIDARRGESRRSWRQSRTLETGFLPGGYTQAFVEVTGKQAMHNAVYLRTGWTDWFAYVEVAVSDDASAWRILRERAPVYRFRRDGLDGNQTIRYPESRSPHLRIRILDGDKRFALGGVDVLLETKVEAERTALPARLAPEPPGGKGQSAWRADLGEDLAPVSQVRFDVTKAEFHRPVRVSASDDGKAWETVGSGQICRIGSGETMDECLEVSFPERQAPHWRVTVYDRDDAPLEGVTMALYATPRHVVFRQEPGRSYRVLYGQSRVKAPVYELARIARRADIDGAARGALGPEETNAAWLDPSPWTERHPWVLWAAAGIAVALLGLLAVQSLRESPGRAA
jgi:hypothetical protein